MGVADYRLRDASHHRPLQSPESAIPDDDKACVEILRDRRYPVVRPTAHGVRDRDSSSDFLDAPTRLGERLLRIRLAVADREEVKFGPRDDRQTRRHSLRERGLRR
jgi:hypothetical protein